MYTREQIIELSMILRSEHLPRKIKRIRLKKLAQEGMSDAAYMLGMMSKGQEARTHLELAVSLDDHPAALYQLAMEEMRSKQCDPVKLETLLVRSARQLFRDSLTMLGNLSTAGGCFTESYYYHYLNYVSGDTDSIIPMECAQESWETAGCPGEYHARWPDLFSQAQHLAVVEIMRFLAGKKTRSALKKALTPMGEANVDVACLWLTDNLQDDPIAPDVYYLQQLAAHGNPLGKLKMAEFQYELFRNTRDYLEFPDGAATIFREQLEAMHPVALLRMAQSCEGVADGHLAAGYAILAALRGLPVRNMEQLGADILGKDVLEACCPSCTTHKSCQCKQQGSVLK